MTYATLMVHLTLGQPNTSVLRVAADLADRFEAGVIGIAACRPMEILYSDGCYVSGDLIAEDQERVQKDLEDAEVAFRTAVDRPGRFTEWRSAVLPTALSDYIEGEARSCDLLVTGLISDATVDRSRRVTAGDLVMQLGRPVFVVPVGATGLALDRVLIAWIDTPETRRATLNALPLLKRAGRVRLVEIAAEDDQAAARKRLEDVAFWLGRHGIEADTDARVTRGDDVGHLDEISRDFRADVIVAGAYGHSRSREWALGGVTRDLLLRAERCSLISH